MPDCGVTSFGGEADQDCIFSVLKILTVVVIS